ncbi:MAG: DUF3300 domain-containing protein [Rudaea sp.]|uniref:DUF3300 domain-containing protein n=1 Tax=Rudaea sp. TaxID=2136325 RepID=UPI0039E38489
MKTAFRSASTALACACLALIAGCDQNKPAAQQTGASAAQLVGDAPATDANGPAGDTAPAYTPPTAAQLISLLAPVAVFPDKLVAQVLVASEYPDEITQANAWLAQNAQLKGDALQQAIDKQEWDPSVKAIVVFPDVLHQMASNIPWTTALGEAYVNDPNDVMNAIQSLRAQALASDKLKSDRFVTVTKTAKNVATPSEQYVDEPPAYSGPPVIPPPDDVIEIEPAQPDYVYVPYFDPLSYYGAPIDLWPGYYYAWPAPVYWGPTFAFGLGIWIGGYHHRGWGWNHWDVGWGRGFDRHWGDRGWRNASVVFDRRPYVGRSTAAIHRFDPAARSVAARANVDSGSRAAAARTTMANAASGARTAPTDFSRITAPRFTAAMAQRSAAVPVRANFAPNRAGFGEARPGALASASYAPASMSRAAPTAFARPGALPSSRYAPSALRGGEAMLRPSNFSARENMRMSSPGYAPSSRPAFAGEGYRAQGLRGYASAPSMRRAAPMASRSFASAPRISMPHYATSRGGSSGGGAGRGEAKSRHR